MSKCFTISSSPHTPFWLQIESFKAEQFPGARKKNSYLQREHVYSLSHSVCELLRTWKDYKGANSVMVDFRNVLKLAVVLGWQKIGIPILGKGHAPKYFLASGQVIWPSHIDPSIYLCLKWLFWRQFLSAWLTGTTVSSGIRSLCPSVLCFLVKDHSREVRGRHCITCIWNAGCLPMDRPSQIWTFIGCLLLGFPHGTFSWNGALRNLVQHSYLVSS